jgi:hypothetical protein
MEDVEENVQFSMLNIQRSMKTDAILSILSLYLNSNPEARGLKLSIPLSCHGQWTIDHGPSSGHEL